MENQEKEKTKKDCESCELLKNTIEKLNTLSTLAIEKEDFEKKERLYKLYVSDAFSNIEYIVKDNLQLFFLMENFMYNSNNNENDKERFDAIKNTLRRNLVLSERICKEFSKLLLSEDIRNITGLDTYEYNKRD